MRSMLLASTAAVFAAASLNTNAGSKLFVCATPQRNDLTQAGYEALTWVEVTGVGNVGEVGSKTNIVSYDTWGQSVIQKGKGMTDAGSPTIEVARDPLDPGQIIMRQIAVTNFNYAFKIQRNDATVTGGTPTIRYNRGLVTGPTEPMGKNEDFDLEVYTLGLQQLQITVDPSAAGNAPVLTVAPAISGTAKVNNVLTVSNGTFTGDATIAYSYTWKRGGVTIPGANGNTYIPVTADIGSVITAVVRATNLAGSAEGAAPPTSAVIA